jgi:deoxyxylulose-5-phosphate synthase
MVYPSLKAAELLAGDGLSAEVVNMRFVKPIDLDLLRELAEKFTYIVTVEDHQVQGGFGSAVLEGLASLQIEKPLHVRLHGIADEFIQHGTPAELYAITKLDAPGIASVVKDFFRRSPQTTPTATLV